jgi:hypothetical protein
MSSLVLTSYRLGLLCPNAITAVVPAKAGTQERLLDSCFRRNDGMGSTPIVQKILATAIYKLKVRCGDLGHDPVEPHRSRKYLE